VWHVAFEQCNLSGADFTNADIIPHAHALARGIGIVIDESDSAAH
jgi:hypothetical protein